MGIVYLAEDTRLARRVVLKFLPARGPGESLDPLAVERFEREARAASALNHPNICTIHDIGTAADGQPFIVMELLEGQTLKQLLASGARSFDETIDIAIQVADGLEAAHARGIVHRDIKPANLFVTRRGQAKILDFGLAKLLPAVDDASVAETRSVNPQHRSGRRDRHGVLHVARAGAGRNARRAHGSLLARTRALRNGDRPPGVHGIDVGHGVRRHPQSRAASDVAPGAGDAAGARRDYRPAPGERPRAAISNGGRRARRPQASAARQRHRDVVAGDGDGGAAATAAPRLAGGRGVGRARGVRARGSSGRARRF